MWAQTVNRQSRISVIIPTLDEEQALPRALLSLSGAAGIELIVVDGGSHDATVSIARTHGCRVVQARGGRGAQLRAGATVGSGHVFLFLHADCVLPLGSIEAIRRVLTSHPEVIAGGFSIRHKSDRLGLRVLDILCNVRARVTKVPWGDQGIFVRREAYDKVGGFHPYPLLEDQDLCRRLKHVGKLVILREQILASPRRWLAQGIGTTLVKAAFIVGLYHLGVSPYWLARFYRNVR
ncbi:TIGR04283 family arsenosugar biosynthesis glycosyltransferase [Acidobacteria bacterium AH-259-O06]|nr:TIGR04283 family arsenosugar biosynthesis glycosyltransferase [Acidobacteria bacterium AH-259-O06]